MKHITETNMTGQAPAFIYFDEAYDVFLCMGECLDAPHSIPAGAVHFYKSFGGTEYTVPTTTTRGRYW